MLAGIAFLTPWGGLLALAAIPALAAAWVVARRNARGREVLQLRDDEVFEVVP